MFDRLLKVLAATAIVGATLTACADNTAPLSPTASAAQDSASALTLPIINFPIPINPARWTEISAGSAHTCARQLGGNVYCWGASDVAQVGAIPSSTCDTGIGKCYGKPTLVSGIGSSTQISAGGNHTCSIQSGGAAYCWGSGNYGELGFGLGLYASYKYPIAVSGGQTFSAIASGTTTTCGIALAASGNIFCWGLVSTPSGTSQLSVPTLFAQGFSPSALAVGSGGLCAIVGAVVDCGGANNVGQTGQTPSSTATAFPATISMYGTANGVAMKAQFACSSDNMPYVYCWGNNASGQLGSGSTASYTSTRQIVGGGLALHGVTTGVNHACALTASNTAVCWGANDYDQVGVSKVTGASKYSTPQAVYGGLTFVALAAGEYHTCGITTDYHLYCWGKNSQHQLGTYVVDANGQPIAGGGYTYQPLLVSDP